MSVQMPAQRVGPRSKTPTWAKLWSLTIIFNLAGFLVAIWVARLIRGGVDSAAAETGLRAAYYISMLIVAFVDALLLDELVFGGAFRRSHLGGETSRFAGSTQDPKDVVVTMQRSSISFPFLVLVTGGLTYLGFNAVNRDFDVYYRHVGTHISTLRHGDPSQHPEAIATLSIRREKEVLPTLKKALAGDAATAPWAAWALGRFGDLPTRRPLFAPLVAAARSDDARLRREALVALGRLQNRRMAEPIHHELRDQLERGEPIDLRLLYALGSIQVMSSLDILEAILDRAQEPAQQMAAWALAQHRDQVGGRRAVELLHQRLPTASPQVRCAIVHSLAILSDERSNLALVAAYDETPPAQRSLICARVEIDMRPPTPTPPLMDDRVLLLTPQDAFGMKIIHTMASIRATTPEIRAQVEPWLERVTADESTLPGPREAGKYLLKAIRTGRDDSTMPTAQDVLGTR